MSSYRDHGRSGDGFARTLGPALHQRSRFHAVALGLSHAELVRRAVDNFIRQPDPAQSAMNRQTAALDRVVQRSGFEGIDRSVGVSRGPLSPAVSVAIGEED